MTNLHLSTRAKFDAVGAVHVANYLSHWTLQDSAPHVIERTLNRDYLLTLEVLEAEAEWKKKASDIFKDSNQNACTENTSKSQKNKAA